MNDQLRTLVQEGRDEAREFASRLRDDLGMTAEEALNAMFSRATQKAALLNVTGANLGGFLQDAARTQGFADYTNEYRYTG